MDDYGDGSTYQIVTLEYDLYEKGDTEPAVTAGSQVLLNENGKIKKSGTVTDVDGYKVTVKDYIVTLQQDEDKNKVYEAEVVGTTEKSAKVIVNER